MRRYGTEVVIIQPTAEDLAVMGRNLMSAERRHDVIETAERTVAEQLRDRRAARAAARGLPKGEPHKISRPAGRRRAGPRSAPRRRRAA